MSIVMGLDQHRAQVTAEWLDTETGEVRRRRVRPADRASVRRFVAGFEGRSLVVALEATTGWRFVVEELERVGAEVHLAEPADTRALRGPKRRAKSDWADARHLRQLAGEGRVPESWVPPAHVQDLRALVRLRHRLSQQRTGWMQYIRAALYHHGCPQGPALRTAQGRAWLASQPLPVAARRQVDVALAMVEALDGQLAALERELRPLARRHRACRALMEIYGIGELVALTVLAELGDTRRFSSSRQAVRFAGLDITVHQSDQRRAPGRLSHQGPPALRWMLYEAAQTATRTGSPDRDYYTDKAAADGGGVARLAIARKLLKRSYHVLRELGDDAVAAA